MRIISWNVNGIRAVCRKGFLEWFEKTKADIVCLQEIKAEIDKVPQDLLNLPGYFSYFNPAIRPGYAGAAVFTKEKPLSVGQGIGLERFDKEGRSLHLKFKDFDLFNLYIPHGGRQKENLDYKLGAYKQICNFIATARKLQKKIILVGDFNIAHQEIDLARPKNNKKNIMFTPDERKQIDKILELGFCDTFRKFHPAEVGQYTWWPYFANARQRNLGWRIDYCFTSKALTSKLKDGFILSKMMGSDHCPVGIEIKD